MSTRPHVILADRACFGPCGVLSPVGPVQMWRGFGYPASCRRDPWSDVMFWNVCTSFGCRGLAGWHVLCMCVMHAPSGGTLPLDQLIVSLVSLLHVLCRVGVGLWHDNNGSWVVWSVCLVSFCPCGSGWEYMPRLGFGYSLPGRWTTRDAVECRWSYSTVSSQRIVGPGSVLTVCSSLFSPM